LPPNPSLPNPSEGGALKRHEIIFLNSVRVQNPDRVEIKKYLNTVS